MCKYHILSKQSQESMASLMSSDKSLTQRMHALWDYVGWPTAEGAWRVGPWQELWASTIFAVVYLMLCTLLTCWPWGLFASSWQEGSHSHLSRWEPGTCRDNWPLPLLLGFLCTCQREEAMFPESLINGTLCCQVLWRWEDLSQSSHPSTGKGPCIIYIVRVSEQGGF